MNWLAAASASVSAKRKSSDSSKPAKSAKRPAQIKPPSTVNPFSIAMNAARQTATAAAATTTTTTASSSSTASTSTTATVAAGVPLATAAASTSTNSTNSTSNTSDATTAKQAKAKKVRKLVSSLKVDEPTAYTSFAPIAIVRNKVELVPVNSLSNSSLKRRVRMHEHRDKCHNCAQCKALQGGVGAAGQPAVDELDTGGPTTVDATMMAVVDVQVPQLGEVGEQAPMTVDVVVGGVVGEQQQMAVDDDNNAAAVVDNVMDADSPVVVVQQQAVSEPTSSTPKIQQQVDGEQQQQQSTKKVFCHSCTVGHTMDRHRKCFVCHRQFSTQEEGRGDDARLVQKVKVRVWRIKYCPKCKCNVHRDQNAVLSFLRILHAILVTGQRAYPYMHYNKATDTTTNTLSH
jgi:hypothetical protein